MICPFNSEKMKECNIRCQYYHTCTRSEYRKKEGQDNGGQSKVLLHEVEGKLLR